MNYNIGRFYVSDRMVRERPELVSEIFAFLRLVPYRVEHLGYRGVFEYIAKSPSFPPSDDFCEPPELKLEVVRSGGTGEFERVSVVDVTGKDWREKEPLSL